MTDKELNMAILDQLYVIADAVWAKMENEYEGSFTAAYINTNIEKYFWWGEVDKGNSHSIEVGNFRCEISSECVFGVVSKFEKLVGASGKNHLFVSSTEGELKGTVTFEVNKDLLELCNFAGDQKTLNPAFNNIYVDAERSYLVATDGFKLVARPITITGRAGDTSDMYINAKDFGKMCRKLKCGEVKSMTVRKECTRTYTKINVDFCGIYSCVSVDNNVLTTWHKLFTKRSGSLCLDVLDYTAVQKFAKSHKNDLIELSGKRGDDYVMISSNDISVKIALGNVLQYGIKIHFDSKDLAAAQCDAMKMYLGKTPNQMIQAKCGNGNFYLITPSVSDDTASYIGNYVDGTLMAPDEEMTVDVLSLPQTTSNPAQEKTTRVCSTKCGTNNNRKFTFEAIGVKVGDELTFIDGTKVLAAADNKVLYKGELYTLSGFCKAFMPDDKRTRSNSYRGCTFFYRDGVKLEKLFKSALLATDKNHVPEKELDPKTPAAECVSEPPVIVPADNADVPIRIEGDAHQLVCIDTIVSPESWASVCFYHTSWKWFANCEASRIKTPPCHVRGRDIVHTMPLPPPMCVC